MFNHIEYDTNSLRDEYCRDLAAGKPIALPHNYFPKTIRPAAGEPLAQPRAPAVRQLDQRDLPDHALRRGKDRDDAGVGWQGRGVGQRGCACPIATIRTMR